MTESGSGSPLRIRPLSRFERLIAGVLGLLLILLGGIVLLTSRSDVLIGTFVLAGLALFVAAINGAPIVTFKMGSTEVGYRLPEHPADTESVSAPDRQPRASNSQIERPMTMEPSRTLRQSQMTFVDRLLEWLMDMLGILTYTEKASLAVASVAIDSTQFAGLRVDYWDRNPMFSVVVNRYYSSDGSYFSRGWVSTNECRVLIYVTEWLTGPQLTRLLSEARARGAGAIAVAKQVSAVELTDYIRNNLRSGPNYKWDDSSSSPPAEVVIWKSSDDKWRISAALTGLAQAMGRRS